MRALNNLRLGLAAITMALCVDPAAAQSGDLFSALFGIFGSRQPVSPRESVPYSSDNSSIDAPATRFVGAISYCVRLCDGRYFPMSHSTASATPAMRCSALCPANATQIYAGNVGSHIAQALAPNGRSYSELPTAFAYRTQLVPDCTCNGKNVFGLAAIAIEADLTLRPGDLVATKQGLKVFVKSKQGARNAENLSPVESYSGLSAKPVRKPLTVSVVISSELQRGAQ